MPICPLNPNAPAPPSITDCGHQTYRIYPVYRDKVVNRLLDWADDSHRRGQELRAEYLIALAWEAYDRL